MDFHTILRCINNGLLPNSWEGGEAQWGHCPLVGQSPTLLEIDVTRLLTSILLAELAKFSELSDLVELLGKVSNKQNQEEYLALGAQLCWCGFIKPKEKIKSCRDVLKKIHFFFFYSWLQLFLYEHHYFIVNCFIILVFFVKINTVHTKSCG